MLRIGILTTAIDDRFVAEYEFVAGLGDEKQFVMNRRKLCLLQIGGQLGLLTSQFLIDRMAD